MKASLRPALFVMGAVTLCGLAVLKSADASSSLSTITEASKDGGAYVELASKDGGAYVELASKDGGASVELASKDGGASVELVEMTKHGKDAGSIAADKSDAGK